MAFLLADRVGETSTTIGTGTLTLLGASTGCRTFLSGIGSGNTCYYSIVNPRTSEWEEGIGTVISGTLERTTVTNSSNADTLVNFKAGTKNVVVSLPAGKLVYKNAAGNVSLPNQTTLSSTDSMLPSSLPSLNLDFVNSGQLDPRITFARNSTAAYYDGKSVAKAEENLLLQSQAFGTLPWVVTGTSITTTETAPDGTATASLWTLLNQYNSIRTPIANISGLIVGATYTVSLWVKNNIGTNVYTIWLDGAFISLGTITPTSTWTRYSFSFVYPASVTAFNILQDRNTSGFGSVYVWGAQLEQRSAVTAYTPTTTSAITNYIPVLKYAAAGVPRFDYDPITGKPLGLLIEEGRTNYLVGSNTPTTQPVGASPPTVTTESIVLPDGTIGMCSKVLFASSGDTRVRVPAYGTWSGNYYFSVFYKVSGDLGWKKYSGAAAIAASLLYFDIGYSGLDGSSWYGKTVYFTFGQLEVGSFATSYIPTIGQTVGRFADSASMVGSNFSSWYNQNQGSLYIQYDTISITTDRTVAELNSGSSANRYLWISNVSGSARDLTFINGSAVVVLDTTASLAAKWASSYGAGVFSSSYNGNTPLISSYTNVAPSINALWLGYTIGGGTAYLNGHIRKLSYYPRALSSSELQGLTK